jgi:hypothetical protein
VTAGDQWQPCKGERRRRRRKRGPHSRWPETDRAWRGQSHAIAAPFEVSHLRQRSNVDFRALLAVHEAGHGLVHALLFGRAPQEVKIHVASFEGGYNAHTSRKVWSRRNLRLHLHQPCRPRRRTGRLRAGVEFQRR